jgi:hypothetical protein
LCIEFTIARRLPPHARHDLDHASPETRFLEETWFLKPRPRLTVVLPPKIDPKEKPSGRLIIASNLSLAASTFATSAATASIATTATTTALEAATLFARACHVDRQAAAVQLVIVEHLDRFFRFGLVRHLDKTKPARAVGLAVQNQ